ncbi:MAG: tRNA 2-thiouridine(34) synthase MnmA [Eubacteriales bacterium]|nr:tRNA 2-thiouridine(34) synthase MnmA [Eubacteriales bacterium]
MEKTVVVGMSGGVDSAVAAYLMKEQGYAPVGVFMKNWEEQQDGVCTAARDFDDVKACCAALDIPYYSVNFSKQYMERVFSYFLDEYRAGRTPNPDVLCNREIKFKELLDMALKLGAGHLVTGHYARVEYHDGAYRLYKGVDASKDQSYFLYMLGQNALSRAIFPLGGMVKGDVRALARRQRLPVAVKKDSTGICFIGERDFKAFLQNYFPAQPGDMVAPDGRILGRHDGLMFYTIGQRSGLHIGGRSDAGGQPWFVVDKDMQRNRLVVAQGGDHPLLFHDACTAGDLHWTAGGPPAAEFACQVKVRYRQSDQSARAYVRGQHMTLHFDQPQRAVTPGQSAVVYIGDECVGGGVIDERYNRR